MMPPIRNRISIMAAGGPHQYAELRSEFMIRATDQSEINNITSELDKLGLSFNTLSNVPVINAKPADTIETVFENVAPSNIGNNISKAVNEVQKARKDGPKSLKASVPTLAATEAVRSAIQDITGVDRVDFVETLADFGPQNLRVNISNIEEIVPSSTQNTKYNLNDIIKSLNIPEAWNTTRGENAIACIFDTSFSEDMWEKDRLIDTFHSQDVDSVWSGPGHHGCVSGDTMVYTSMCGGEEIEKLYHRIPEDETEYKGGYMKNVTSDVRTVSLDGSSPEEKQVSAVYRTKANEETKIKLEGNRGLKLTPWHKVFIFDGEEVIEKRADEVEEGDFVILPGKEIGMFDDDEYPEVSYVYDHDLESAVIDERLGYLIGLFIAEGSITESNSVNPAQITNSNGGVVNKLKRCASESGYTIKKTAHGSSNVYEITDGFTQLLLEIGFTSGSKSKTVSIPEVVWKSPPSVRKACLAGMIDGDGSINKNEASIRYSTRSFDLAKDMHTLLASLGVYGRSYTEVDEREEHTIQGVEVDSSGVDYKVRISGGSLEWMKNNVASYMAHDERKILLSFKEPHFGVDRVPYSHSKIKEIASRIGCNVNDIGAHASRDRTSFVTVDNMIETVNSYYGFADISDIEELMEFMGNHWFLEVKDTKTSELEDDKWYYDLTVPDTENYMANGVIIHNSMTSGAMAADDKNGRPFNGVAPDSDVILIRITGPQGQIKSNIISKGWDWLLSKNLSKPVVTNHSYGTPLCSGRPKSKFCDTVQNDIIKVANADAGITSVYAAGNAADRCGHRPSGLTNGITGTNSLESLITVGAMMSNGKMIQRYSSHGRGDCSPIADPKPNVSIRIPQVTYWGKKSGWGVKDMSYGAIGSAGGTSHASPLVAGIVTLMQSAAVEKYQAGNESNNEMASTRSGNGVMQTAEVKDILTQSSSPPHPNQINQIGFGLSQKGYGARFGYGEPDINKAMEMI